MYKLLDGFKARAQQFTPLELKAEILRQRFQELREKGLEVGNDPRNRANMQKLDSLERSLAAIEKHAQLHTQGRVLMGKYLDMLEGYLESRDIPPKADEIMGDYRKWMEAMEDDRRKRYLRNLSVFRQTWPLANWAHRGRMINWLGRRTVRRFANERLRYRVGRLALGCASTLLSRRHRP